MQYKLLALDIDGTIVPEHTNTISDAVHAAIQKAKENIIVTLVSARARDDQQIIIDSLGLDARYHVIENGTKVLNPEGRIEYTLYVPNTEVERIEHSVQGLCESIGYCIDGKWVQSNPKSNQDSVTTLSVIATKEAADRIALLVETKDTHYSITVGNHWSNPDLSVVLISHKNASKGGGLQYVQKILGITSDQTIAVGDGASDVPMMNQAKIKVAMGNAEDKLKKIATHTVGSVNDDGLVEVIEQFVL